jgi:hypothetical protein
VWALSGTYGAFTPLMYTPASGVSRIRTARSAPVSCTSSRATPALKPQPMGAPISAFSLRRSGNFPARPNHSFEFLGLQ